MANINNTLLLKTQKILEEPQGAVNLIDIDYKLIEDPDDPYTTKHRMMIEKNYDAILNSYRLWLQSKKGDYIREKDMGGLFTYALNDKVAFKPENEPVVSDLVISESKKFFNDIDVIECNVKCNVRDRNWDIEVVVLDKATGTPMVESLSINAEE